MSDKEMGHEPKTLSVERHGIDFVPRGERYGTPRRLFTIWFSVNLTLLCLTAGMLGISAGLPLGWTVGGIALGNAIGTVLMAAHSAQGPHLGIPQMIQSRAQFGVLGAALPLVAVVAEATLYTAADGVIVRDTLKGILPLDDYSAIVLFGAITLIAGFMGYELIHKLGAALLVISGTLLLTVAALLPFHTDAGGAMPVTSAHFTVATFIMVVTQGTAWSLGSAPYVADYSRYLPATVSTSRTFWCTGMGNFLGATLIMGFGAYIAFAYPNLAAHPGSGIAELFGRGRYLVSLLIAAGLLQVNVMNLYSAYMSTVTIVSGMRSMERITLPIKFLLMASLMAVATGIAIVARENFNLHFSDLLIAVVYVLVPWSAINLADYYLLRKGRYSIDEMFRRDGLYGNFQWSSITIYLLSIAVQIPFMRLSFYVGPLARLVGADVAWLPGTIIPTLLYYLIQKSRTRALNRRCLSERGA
jgi:nucleobase:cation symporter-1, NCS1 family